MKNHKKTLNKIITISFFTYTIITILVGIYSFIRYFKDNTINLKNLYNYNGKRDSSLNIKKRESTIVFLSIKNDDYKDKLVKINEYIENNNDSEIRIIWLNNDIPLNTIKEIGLDLSINYYQVSSEGSIQTPQVIIINPLNKIIYENIDFYEYFVIEEAVE